MKMLCLLILCVSIFPLHSVELHSAEAFVDKKKNVKHDAPETIDGDLESVWTKTCDYKVELVIHLKESVKMKSIAMIWGEASPQDLEIKFKTKGRKKKSGPRYKTKEGLSPDVFDLTDFDVSSKEIHIFMIPKENNKVISIKEIKINNGEKVFTHEDQPVETNYEADEDPKEPKSEESKEALDDEADEAGEADEADEPKLSPKKEIVPDEYETDF